MSNDAMRDALDMMMCTFRAKGWEGDPAYEKAEAALATPAQSGMFFPKPGTTEFGSIINKARNDASQSVSGQTDGHIGFFKWTCHVVRYLMDCAALAAQTQNEEKLNRTYSERNELAIAFTKAAIAAGWNAGKGTDGNEDWADEWRNVVYVDLPDGLQVSWHIAPSELKLLEGLPEYNRSWDGTMLGRSVGWSKAIKPAQSEAKREGEFTDADLVGAVVLTFPTKEQTWRVSDALVNAPIGAGDALTDAEILNVAHGVGSVRMMPPAFLISFARALLAKRGGA